MTLALGLDVGTQGTKGVVVDLAEHRVVARAASSYGLIEGLPPGAAEQHPDTWIEAAARVCAELLATPRVERARVRAIGVSGQQHGLVALDADGRVVRPAKLWCDTSTLEEARELSQLFGASVPVGFTASKVRWLARREPERWARTQHVLLPHDYVNYRLTGRFTMEAGDASGTGFFDPRARAFDVERARAIDPRLPELLPPLVREGEPAGRVDARGAAWSGVPAGTLVAAGGGDNMMSAVGSGATRAGVVVASLGTSGTVFAHSDAPRIDPAGLIAPFCASVGGWLPLVCVMNCTGVPEEVRALTGLAHEALTDAARGVPAGCDGLLWLPFLAGERVPDLPHASAALLGMRAGHLRAGILYRAALEGASLALAWGVDRMRALGIRPRELHVVGGAARNRLWRAILASVMDVVVHELEERESAALGAALQAAWTLEREAGGTRSAHEVAAPFVRRAGEPTEPDAAWVERYRESRERYADEVRTLAARAATR
jgi:xylulokinase